MPQPDIVTAIDVGTSKVLALIASIDGPGKPQLLARSTVPCEGLERGNVEDASKTTAAVRAALREVEAQSGFEVRSAYVSLSGAHIGYENRRDQIQGAGAIGVITPEELDSAAPNKAAKLPEDRELVHAMPISYAVDGEEGIRNPVGMHSGSVEVETHLMTADRDRVAHLSRAVGNAGVSVDSFVMNPLASGLSVLSAEEIQCGTMLVDIGAGTSDVVIFNGGRLCYTCVIPVGGYQFTNDVCVTYNSEFEATDRAKQAFGHTQPSAVDATQNITLPLRERPANVSVSLRELAQLFSERASELSKMVRIKLKEAEAEHALASKAVLTGGTSQLPGIGELFQRQLGRAVRVGSPTGVSGGSALNDPADATGIGMLIWASTRDGARNHVRKGARNSRNGSNGGGGLSRLLGRKNRETAGAGHGGRS